MPCARGSSVEKLIVFVCRRIYIFQESLPLSRPPPVSFSPPKAPPISAPLVPVLTLAMPQSLPAALINFSASRISFVKTAGQALGHAVVDCDRLVEITIGHQKKQWPE